MKALWKILPVLLLSCLIYAIAWKILARHSQESDMGPQMDVLILNDGSIARFVSKVNDSTYMALSQDNFTVSSADARLERWRAADGKGIVYSTIFGSWPVKAEPDDSSKTIALINYEDGFVPDTYPCLGYRDGWFEISFNSRKGYVSKRDFEWDAINSF